MPRSALHRRCRCVRVLPRWCWRVAHRREHLVLRRRCERRRRRKRRLDGRRRLLRHRCDQRVRLVRFGMRRRQRRHAVLAHRRHRVEEAVERRMGAVARMGERRRLGEVVVLRRRANWSISDGGSAAHRKVGRDGSPWNAWYAGPPNCGGGGAKSCWGGANSCASRGMDWCCSAIPRGAPKSCGIGGGGGCMAKSPGDVAPWCICGGRRRTRLRQQLRHAGGLRLHRPRARTQGAVRQRARRPRRASVLGMLLRRRRRPVRFRRGGEALVALLALRLRFGTSRAGAACARQCGPSSRAAARRGPTSARRSRTLARTRS